MKTNFCVQRSPHSLWSAALLGLAALSLAACETSDKMFGTDLANPDVNPISANDGGSNEQEGFLGCLSGESLERDSIQITFEFPAKASRMSIYLDGILVASFTNRAVTTYKKSNLTQGVSYRFTCEGTFDGLAKRGTRELVLSTLMVDSPTFGGLTYAQPASPNSVLLKWKPATGVPVNHYQLFKKLGSSLNMDLELPIREDLPLGTTQVTVSGLGDELPYTFGVRACATPVGAAEPLCSENTAVSTVTLPNGGAPQTTGASAAVAANGQVTLTVPWSDPMGAVKKRRVYRNTTGGTNLATYTLVQTVDVSLTSADFTNPPTSILVPGVVVEGNTYYYIVQDEDSTLSNGNLVPVSVEVSDQTPPTFLGIQTLEAGTLGNLQQDTVLKAGFDAIASQKPNLEGASDAGGASVYLVYKTEANFPDAPADPCVSGGEPIMTLAAEDYIAPNRVNFEIKNLTPKKNYRVCIKARDEAGNVSNTINYRSKTTWDLTPPVFDGIQSLSYSDGKLVAAWNAATPASDVKEYRVKVWKGTATPTDAQITTVLKASPGFDTGFQFASPLDLFTFTDGEKVYVLVDACDNATIYGGPQQCTSFALGTAKDWTIPDTTAPTISLVQKTGTGSLWDLSWVISDNITPPAQLFVKVRRKNAATNNDFPTLAAEPVNQGAGLTAISSETGPENTEGYMNYLLEVIEPGTNLSGTVTYSVPYDRKAPDAATGLGWLETSPVRTMPVTAKWTRSASGDVATQKIRFYSSSDCTTGGGSTTTLGLNDESKSFTAGSEGTYTFQVITSDAANNASTACSPPLRYDWTSPRVLSVSSSTPNGSYTVAHEILISINFDEEVAVTGTPRLQLNVGGATPYAEYVSGSGTSSLTFRYRVVEGQNTSDLDYTGTTALILNGGTMKDLAQNDADRTLKVPGEAGSLGASKDIVIDTDIAGITILSPADGTIINAATQSATYPVSGTCSEKGNAITLSIGGMPTGASVTCQNDNTWSATIDAVALGHSPLGSSHVIMVEITKTVNGSVASDDITIVKDVTPPSNLSVALVSPETSPGLDPTPTLEISGTALSAGDLVGIYVDAGCTLAFQKASGTAEDSTPQLTTVALLDGTYEFHAKATDVAGNESACSAASVTYLLDRAAPDKATALGWVQASPRNNVLVTAQWTPSASIDLASQKIQFFSDSACETASGAAINLGKAVTTQAFTAPADGTYAYRITSIDNAGNQSVECSSSMKIDRVGPTLSFTSPADGAYANAGNYTNYAVTGSCENGGSDVTITVTGSVTVTKTATCTGTFSTTVNLTTLADGALVFSGSQQDLAGNTGTTLVNPSVTKDIVKPTVTIGVPSVTSLGGSGSVSFDVTYSGATTRNLTVDGVTLNVTGDVSCTKAVSNGTTATPVVSLSGCTGTGTIGITINANTATDAAGNGNAASAASGTVTVDATAPTAPPNLGYTPSGGVAGWYYFTNQTPIFNWNASTDASGIDRYEIAIGLSAGGSTIVNWTSTALGTTKQFSPVALTEGTTYYATVKAFDPVGNASGISSVSWRVDVTAPSAPTAVDDGTQKMSQDSSPTITWNASTDALSGIDHYEIAVGTSIGQTNVMNWTAVGNVTSFVVTGLTLGTNNNYYATVRAVDKAGNVSSGGQGNGWLSLPDPCASLSRGQACTGGALFAGEFKGSRYMVTPGGCTDSATPTCAGGVDTLTKPGLAFDGNWAGIPGVEFLLGVTTVATQSGMQNTPPLAAAGGTAAVTAARYCDNLDYGGYQDWFLPSKSELAYLSCHTTSGSANASLPEEDPGCANYGGRTFEIPGFGNGVNYWSSTFNTGGMVWYSRVGTMGQGSANAGTASRYRCVRKY